MSLRTPLSIEVKKVLKLLMYTLLGMLLVSSSYIFLKMSTDGQKGYLLREHQSRQRALEGENRLLKKQVLDVQSLSELKVSPILKEMAEPEKSLYVETSRPLTKKRP